MGHDAELVAQGRCPVRQQKFDEQTRIAMNGHGLVAQQAGRQRPAQRVIAVAAAPWPPRFNGTGAPDIDRASEQRPRDAIEKAPHGNEIAAIRWRILDRSTAERFTQRGGEPIAEIRFGAGPVQTERPGNHQAAASIASLMSQRRSAPSGSHIHERASR